MVERRNGVGFTLEATHTVGVVRELEGEQLERDLAMQLFVFGEPLSLEAGALEAR